MKINDIILNVRIGWSLREDVPFILGRLDVFDKFHIEFREDENVVVFQLVKTQSR